MKFLCWKTLYDYIYHFHILKLTVAGALFLLSTHILYYEDFSFHKSEFKLRKKWDFVYKIYNKYSTKKSVHLWLKRNKKRIFMSGVRLWYFLLTFLEVKMYSAKNITSLHPYSVVYEIHTKIESIVFALKRFICIKN